jgi:hypothetical protein
MIMQKAERKRGFEWRARIQYKRKDSRIEEEGEQE